MMKTETSLNILDAVAIGTPLALAWMYELPFTQKAITS